MAHQSIKYLWIILEIIMVVAIDLIKKQRKEPVSLTLVCFTSRVKTEKGGSEHFKSSHVSVSKTCNLLF